MTMTTAPKAPHSSPMKVRLERVASALDSVAQGTAWVLSKFTRVSSAGVFVDWGYTSFVDAWREDHRTGGRSYVLRLGIVEFMVDCRAPKSPKGAAAAQ